MTRYDKARSGKRSYVKPALTRVELVPDEAVLGNCRVTTASTGRGSTPYCRSSDMCSLLGSSTTQAGPQQR
jgi:hypothetical protein